MRRQPMLLVAHCLPHAPPTHPPSMKEQPSCGSSLAVVPGSSVEKMLPKSVLTCLGCVGGGVGWVAEDEGGCWGDRERWGRARHTAAWT